MNFIEAVIAINEREDLEFCTDLQELTGEHSSICIYKNGSFIGKLRWPNISRPEGISKFAFVDEELINELRI